MQATLLLHEDIMASSMVIQVCPKVTAMITAKSKMLHFICTNH